MAWLKDKNGAIYRIESITGVVPLEKREDRRDQTKVTAVHASITTVGGHTHNTDLDFADVTALVDPAPAASTPS